MLSHQSVIPLPMTFSHQDKWVHASAYALMGLLAWRAFHPLFPKQKVLAWVSIIFCSLYGMSDEFHQSFIEGRNADVWDWFADTVGASIMVIILFRRRH